MCINLSMKWLWLCLPFLISLSTLTRIFPSPESTKFLTYMNPPSYSDYLLDAWEIRYAEDRETGRNILKQKCYQNVHLKK